MAKFGERTLVKDELPGEEYIHSYGDYGDDEVIVCDKDGSVFSAIPMIFGKFIWVLPGEDFAIVDNEIVAWMPMPSPYKKQEKV